MIVGLSKSYPDFIQIYPNLSSFYPDFTLTLINLFEHFFLIKTKLTLFFTIPEDFFHHNFISNALPKYSFGIALPVIQSLVGGLVRVFLNVLF
jgi:hypothetical protein